MNFPLNCASVIYDQPSLMAYSRQQMIFDLLVNGMAAIGLGVLAYGGAMQAISGRLLWRFMLSLTVGVSQTVSTFYVMYRSIRLSRLGEQADQNEPSGFTCRQDIPLAACFLITALDNGFSAYGTYRLSTKDTLFNTESLSILIAALNAISFFTYFSAHSFGIWTRFSHHLCSTPRHLCHYAIVRSIGTFTGVITVGNWAYFDVRSSVYLPKALSWVFGLCSFLTNGYGYYRTFLLRQRQIQEQVSPDYAEEPCHWKTCCHLSLRVLILLISNIGDGLGTYNGAVQYLLNHNDPKTDPRNCIVIALSVIIGICTSVTFFSFIDSLSPEIVPRAKRQWQQNISLMTQCWRGEDATRLLAQQESSIDTGKIELSAQ